MRTGKLLIASAVALLAPAAAVVVWGVASLAGEAERARTKHAEEAQACAATLREALLAAARGDGGIAWRTDRDGTLLEPAPSGWRFPVESDAVGVARGEIDALELAGDAGRARKRLREFAADAERDELAAWALTALAAAETRAGNAAAARAARRELIERFPDERDASGLLRAHAARFAELENDADALALLSDLTDDRAALEHTAPASLAARVVAYLDGREAQRVAELAAHAAARTRVLALQATWPTGVSDWLASGAAGASASFELAADPLSPSRDGLYVAARGGGDEGWSGIARTHRELAAAALARPEVEAWRTLGFVGGYTASDGALLAGASAESTENAARLALASPFDGVSAFAFGTDFEGFVARERRRLLWIASFAGAAWLAAAIAAVATVRAVTREARAAKQRQDFVAAVTHELKAPLASIRLFAELLERGGVEDAKVREFGARTVGESDRLSRVVSSVLELARIERGNGAVAIAQRVALDELVREVAASFELRAKRLGFELEVRAESVHVAGNADALRGALIELVDNALTHAREPHELEIEVRRAGDRARIAVLDRGPGVPASERERIFEPFHRVGDELVRERPGVGLGLALVARVAAAHGGRAWCEAREGGGSVFVIEIPAMEPTA